MKQTTGIEIGEYAARKGARVTDWGKDCIEIHATTGPRKGASVIVSKGYQRPSVVGFIFRVLRWMAIALVLLAGYAVAIRIP